MINTQTSTLIQAMSSSITQAMKAMVRQLPNALSIDASAFTNAFQMNMDASQLQAALASMMSSSSSSKESNLSTLGYADVKDPNAIVIYPKDFESKSEIINILDAYNEEMKNADEDKVITYTDLVGTLMTSVTDIDCLCSDFTCGIFHYDWCHYIYFSTGKAEGNWDSTRNWSFKTQYFKCIQCRDVYYRSFGRNLWNWHNTCL